MYLNLLNFFIILNIIGFIQSSSIFQDDTIIYPCENDEMCLNNYINASCINNECVCENHENCQKINEDMKFVRKIGKNCKSSKECKIENSYCGSGICKCNKGFVISSTQKQCLRVSDNINSECIDDAQCININGICTNKICTCRSGSFQINNVCVKSLGIGDECISNNECNHIQNSICFPKKCSCRIGYVQSGLTKCISQGESIHSSCTENIQCTSTLGEGSQCLNNTCQCKEIFHYKPSTNECVRDILFGEICKNHEDCHQPGNEPSRLECLIGECKCKYPYYEENNYCISAANVLQSIFYFKYVFLFIALYKIVL